MIKILPVKSITPLKNTSLVFFSFSDKKSITKTLRTAEKLLNLKNNSLDNWSPINLNDILIFTLKDSGNILIHKIGKRKKIKLDTIRREAAKFIQFLISSKIPGVIIKIPPPEEFSFVEKTINSEKYLIAFIEGIFLGSYKYNKYKKAKDSFLPEVHIFQELINIKLLRKIISKYNLISESVFIARDLQNTPSNDLTPSIFAGFIKNKLSGTKVKFSVIDYRELKINNLNGLIAVGKGSINKPKFITLSYTGSTKTDKKIILIGKGITFDTGGISIKPANNMGEMKADMAGASAVFSVIYAASKLKMKTNLIGLIPLAENMPSGSSIKPGDIIKTKSGITIEIDNTDAEGRLIISDALEVAKSYNPYYVIDIATLTGAVAIALGPYYAGFFSNDELLTEKLKTASANSGERIWELPLDEDFNTLIKSKYADIKNTGGREGGAISAAMFLSHIVDGKFKWAHIDIASTVSSQDIIPYYKDFMTGFGVRLLLDLLFQESE